MPEKIRMRDARGKLVLGSFEVHEGMITVTASDGRTKTAVVAEVFAEHRNPSEITSSPVAEREAAEWLWSVLPIIVVVVFLAIIAWMRVPLVRR